MNTDNLIFCVLIIALVCLLFVSSIGYFRARADEAEPYITETTVTKPAKPLQCDVIYDIPLPDELQIYTAALCEQYDVPLELIIAIMWRESRFDLNAVSNAGFIGLMQINPEYADDLMNELDIYDLTEPCQNIRAGIHIFAQYYHKYGNPTQALMCYNCGEVGASELWMRGIISSDYTRDIIDYVENIRDRERVYSE